MTPLLRAVLVVSSLLMFAGCRGPKGSPGGSVKSFFSSVVAEDWEAMAEIVSDQSLKRIGGKQRALGGFARNYSGWKGADITIVEELEDNDGTQATVIFNCVSTQMVNYKAQKFDCSDTYLLAKQEDGKWHVHLPGATSLKPMQ